MRFTRSVAGALLTMLFVTMAAAQDWPTRPMTLVVPFAAGGGVDVSARIQAQKMGELRAQQHQFHFSHVRKVC